MIAGLIAPDRGRMRLDDTVLFDSAARIDVAAHRRRIGYVFQEGRLFPHLSVASNLDYGRRMSRLPADPAETKRIESSSILPIWSTAGRARSRVVSGSVLPAVARCFDVLGCPWLES